MSRGKNLQEMEVGTKQSKTAVNASAQPADPMQKLTTGIPDGQTGSWEDLGGPTPENYKSDDDSAKLKDAGAGLKQVKDVVNKGAKSADPMKGLNKSDAVKEEEESEYDEDEELLEASKKNEEDEEAEDTEEGDEGEDDDKKKMKEEFDIEEDVNALLHGEDLSEEFQEKARVIFESALRTKVNEIRESLEVQYEAKLVEEVQVINEELKERIDAYLEYVAEEWVDENSLAIETGLKEELTESFLGGLKQLFEEHYVSIPEEKYLSLIHN